MTERSAGLAVAQLRSARNAPPTTRRRAALRWSTANPNGATNQEQKKGKNSVYTEQLTLPLWSMLHN
jgi:hypothetical protein